MFPIEQFHPLVVHFPIVFMLSLAVFDATLVARGVTIGGRGGVADISAGLAGLAGIAAAVAFIFGNLALDVAIAAGTPVSLLETHEDLGHVTVLVLLAWAFLRGILWWRKASLTKHRALLIVVAELGMAVLIVATAYFGGQLVYEFGIGVASMAAVANSP